MRGEHSLVKDQREGKEFTEMMSLVLSSVASVVGVFVNNNGGVDGTDTSPEDQFSRDVEGSRDTSESKIDGSFSGVKILLNQNEKLRR